MVLPHLCPDWLPLDMPLPSSRWQEAGAGQGSARVEVQSPREEDRAKSCQSLPLSDGQWCRDGHSPCSRSGKLCLQSAALCHYGEWSYHAEPEKKMLVSLNILPARMRRKIQDPAGGPRPSEQN